METWTDYQKCFAPGQTSDAVLFKRSTARGPAKRRPLGFQLDLFNQA